MPNEEKSEFDAAVEKIIASFHSKMEALASLSETQLTHAKERQQKYVEEIISSIVRDTQLLKSGTLNPYDAGRAANSINENVKQLITVHSFSHESVLAETIFISIFSSFDAYLNQLLHVFYSAKPQLLISGDHDPVQDKAEHRTVTFVDVLNHDRDRVIAAVIDKEIESLLRSSYIKVFDRLAKRFGIGTLKEFKNWPRFVECSQRRNLITHCGGIVNRQYLETCQSHEVQFENTPKPGEKLEITREYLDGAMQLMVEVGIKLGQILWRNFGPDSIDVADIQLGELIYDLLKWEKWGLALRFGEFGRECAMRNYKRPRNERTLKIITINHAQAAKWSGDDRAAIGIVNAADWSGSSLDFKMAAACLNQDWDEAAALMEEIGKNSKLVGTSGYIGWPIFREFRQTKPFSDSFKNVFGVEFAAKAADEADKASELAEPEKEPPEETENASGPNP